jgi:hypothetical protein
MKRFIPKMCHSPRFYTPIKLQKNALFHTKFVSRSTLLHAYKTTKKCIQFLNEIYLPRIIKGFKMLRVAGT